MTLMYIYYYCDKIFLRKGTPIAFKEKKNSKDDMNKGKQDDGDCNERASPIRTVC